MNTQLRRFLRWFGIGTAISLGLISLMLVSGYIYVQSESGRMWLVGLLNHQLSTPGSSEVRIGRIEGNLLQRFEIYEISLSDSGGSWLQLGHAAADWRPRDLLDGRLSISNLDIEGLVVSRFPLSPENPGKPEDFSLPLAVSIHNFTLADTRLEKPLLGEEVVFRASGDTAIEGSDLVRSSITVKRIDSIPGQARLEMKLQPRSKFLQFKIDLDEESGGVLARLLEVEGLPALSIHADGGGPLDAVRGNASLRLGELDFVESSFTIVVEDEPELKLEGRARIEKIVDQQFRQFLLGDVLFYLDGKLKDGTILLREAVFVNDLARIELSGAFSDYAGDFKLAASIDDLTPFSDVAGTPLQGKANIRTQAVSSDFRRSFTVSVSSALSDLSIQTNEWIALLGPQVNLDARLDVNADKDWQFRDGTILLEEAVIANDLARVELSGVFSDYAGDFKLAASVGELIPFSDLAGMPLHGKANIQTQVVSTDFRRNTSVSVITVLSELSSPTNEWLALLGPQVNFQTNFDVDADQDLQLRDLQVTTEAIELTANGSIGRDLSKLDTDFRLLIPRLAVLSSSLGSAIAGELKASGKISGDLNSPALSAHLLSPALRLEEILLGATEARLNMPQLIDKIAGDIELTIDNDRFGEVVLESVFSEQDNDQIKLNDLMIASRNTRLAGDLVFDLAGATATGKLEVKDFALAAWSDLAGQSLSGVASVSFDMSDRGKGQGLEINLSSSDFSVELDDRQSIQVGSLEAGARFDDLFESPVGAMRLLAANTRISDVELASVLFEAKIDSPERLSGRLVTRGEFYQPFELKLDADYSAGKSGHQFAISELTAMVSGESVTLSKPLLLSQKSGKTTLSKTTLLVADGSLSASAEIDDDNINASLKVDGISIAALEGLLPTSGVTGSISAQALVTGSRIAPVGEMELKFENIQSTHRKLSVAAPISARIRADWRDNRMHLNASLIGATENSFDAIVNVPLQLKPKSLALAMPADQAIDGGLNWSGDLEPVWNLLSQQEDRFSGPAEIALVLDGRVDNPQIGGFFQLRGGRYENVQTATTIVDVNLRLVGNGDKLVLEELSASDGKSGKLQGSGFVDFLPAQYYPTNLHLEFTDMLLTARDDISFNASADLKLEGNLADALLSGEIVTGQSVLSLSGSLPPGVVDLEVEEVNLTDATHAKEGSQKTKKDSSRLELDLKLSIPGRSYVRGLGLESEWTGEIEIKGDSNAPKLSGVLSPVRGRFFLMGKSFRLESGTIRFTGSDDIDPLLDLTAQHSVSSLTALVRVTGSASNPSIALSSRPPLPESEIASQVLFGTNSGNLSTAQSLQLASAIGSFSGRGGSLGILDATRRALSVDVINFTDSEQNPDKTRVSVGKYISEGVYLEVEGGGDRDSRTSTTVEVEVLPNVRFEGGTTETGGNQVGIRWKWDY